MRPKLFTKRTLRIETIENRHQLFIWNTGSLIFDSDENRPAVIPRGQPDFARRFRFPICDRTGFFGAAVRRSSRFTARTI